MEKITNRYLCVHGHFYQPPRENPWTDTIQVQKSAFPYHDWNERITRECYGPNASSRLNGENGYISKLVNNYELMSFNFGPTLLSWLEINHPWIYSMILEGDRLSRDRFGGHGNAISQVYNHIIMPLASKRDKITQVRWGIADFTGRFNRRPEGMWLSETAVDNETLEVMAHEGIKFTILSPYQADSIRCINKGSEWADVSGGAIDCSKPYRCFPSEDKSVYIDLFFYNGPISRSIAYEKLLGSGESFLKKIISSYPAGNSAPSLLSIATDGESYGHHFKFGEMALTWVLEMINSGPDISLTNYGQFLEIYPPDIEVKIVENSAWSCAHGVERWRSDCGCSVSQNPVWTQKWRTPLRDGLNSLNNRLAGVFEGKTKDILKDCWKARNDYIEALISPAAFDGDRFILEHSLKNPDEYEKKLLLRLLESQKMALFMFTSCGWFFDDIAGLEVVQILMYAKRAIELCREFTKTDMENELLSFLEKADCNAPEYENGRDVYIHEVSPLQIDDNALLANFGMLMVLDSNYSVPWLERIIRPEKENILKFNDLLVFKAVSGVSVSNESDAVTACIAVRSKNNDMAAISGIINKSNLVSMEKKINNTQFTDSNINWLIDLIKPYFKEIRVFLPEELIPDVKIYIEKIFAENIKKGIYAFLSDKPDLLENYIKILSLNRKAPPEELMSLLYIFTGNLFTKLFKSPADSPIDYSSIESFMELFKWESVNEKENSEPFDPATLLKQDCIKSHIEDFLCGQIHGIQHDNININLNNIIKTIDFINKYKLEIDFWIAQNIFGKYRTGTSLSEIPDFDTKELFRQAEHLLGFTGGIYHA